MFLDKFGVLTLDFFFFDELFLEGKFCPPKKEVAEFCQYGWWFRNPANQFEVGRLKNPIIYRVFLHPRWVFSPDFWTINSLWRVFVACEAAIVWESWISGGTMARSELIWWMAWFCWLPWLLTICTCDMRMRFVADVSIVQQKIESTRPQESLQILSGLGLDRGFYDVAKQWWTKCNLDIGDPTSCRVASTRLKAMSFGWTLSRETLITRCEKNFTCTMSTVYRWVRLQANLPITYLGLVTRSRVSLYLFTLTQDNPQPCRQG